MRVLPIAICLLALAGCATPAKLSDSRLRPAAQVDAARHYSGTWFEIGRRPMKLTDGCVAGGTTYTPEGEGKVRVLDFCFDGTPEGKPKTVGGPGRIVDPGTNARLHVNYRLFGVVPVARDYWVLEAGDGSWFISADPSFRELWIYMRKPNPTQAELAPLVARAKALGYDTSLLEFPQTGNGRTP